MAGNERCNCQFDTGLGHYSMFPTHEHPCVCQSQNPAFSIVAGQQLWWNLMLWYSTCPMLWTLWQAVQQMVLGTEKKKEKFVLMAKTFWINLHGAPENPESLLKWCWGLKLNSAPLLLSGLFSASMRRLKGARAIAAANRVPAAPSVVIHLLRKR